MEPTIKPSIKPIIKSITIQDDDDEEDLDEDIKETIKEHKKIQKVSTPTPVPTKASNIQIKPTTSPTDKYLVAQSNDTAFTLAKLANINLIELVKKENPAYKNIDRKYEFNPNFDSISIFMGNTTKQIYIVIILLIAYLLYSSNKKN
jgi:hypothetical protein